MGRETRFLVRKLGLTTVKSIFSLFLLPCRAIPILSVFVSCLSRNG